VIMGINRPARRPHHRDEPARDDHAEQASATRSPGARRSRSADDRATSTRARDLIGIRCK